MERDAREGRPPGMAGDHQRPRPKRAMGQEKSTEGSCDQMTCAVLMCVHAGRREPQGRKHGGERGGKEHTKPKTKPHSATRGREGQSEQEAGERAGANGQTRDRGGRATKKQQQQQVTRWGKGTCNGGRGGQEEGPTTGPEGSHTTQVEGGGKGATSASDPFPWGAWPQDTPVDTHKQAGRQSTALTGASLRSCHVTKPFRVLSTLQQGNKSMYSNTSGYAHMGLRLDWGKGITRQ